MNSDRGWLSEVNATLEGTAIRVFSPPYLLLLGAQYISFNTRKWRMLWAMPRPRAAGKLGPDLLRLMLVYRNLPHFPHRY